MIVCYSALKRGSKMFYYLLPVQCVLLEFVIKLGETIFFPADAREEDIIRSSLSVQEKQMLNRILEKNRARFETFGNCAFLLISSKYDVKNIISDPNILEIIFSEANRSLDYVRVLECPFGKPEYFLGVPGVYKTRKYLISVNDDLSVGAYVEGKEYFYSMQKGIGLDIGIKETNDEFLYKALYSSRTDEVYNIFRKYIGEACEALRIADESRCFVYLFSKVDGMGLCEEYQFTDNKKRILSIIAKNQREFDLLSSELYFYSKEIRTEVVHKGRKIVELMSLDRAKEMNQRLFNIIIKFCVAIIDTGIAKIDALKTYIDVQVGKYNYVSPLDRSKGNVPNISYPITTYIAEIGGTDIGYPQKRGDYIILPKLKNYGFKRYYENYVMKDLGESCDKEFETFTVEDFEYIIEILPRISDIMNDTPVVIGLNLPRMMEDYSNCVKTRELVVDYICNKINHVFYYDLLSGGEIINGDILPPRVGMKNRIRVVYEFVEAEEEMYVRSIPGRVYGEYEIPKQEYKCVTTYRDDVYNILYASTSCIGEMCKSAFVNLCELEYIFDWTQRISFLFDIFDSLDPRTYKKDKTIKLVFAFLAVDRSNYDMKKHYYESVKDKYRNPILHGGRNIFEIESNRTEIEKLEIYMKNLILEFCLKICSLGITTWEELDNEYRNQQRRLNLI